MKLILDEKKKIEEILETGKIDKKPSATISLLAKYYNTLGKSEDQIIHEVDTFMTKNYSKYNEVTWGNLVESIAKQAVKANRKLIEVDSVGIYDSEIELIQTFGDEKIQKLAFTFLVYAKIANQINHLNNNWVLGKHITEIFKDANVTETGMKQNYTLHEMIKKDILVTTERSISTSLSVEYYVGTEARSKEVLTITDFRQLGLQWLKYLGTKGIKECTQCGQLIKLKTPNSNQKYCTECAKKIKNKTINESKKKKRAIQKKMA